MKILVFSDSHGESSGMIAAVRQHRPDMIVHLGDGARDADELEATFPDIPFQAVRGNRDFNTNRPERLCFQAGSIKIFATHGHLYRNFDSFLNAAHLSGAALALYGHTHVAKIKYHPGLTSLNPGTVGKGRKLSYAIVEPGENAVPLCKIINI